MVDAGVVAFLAAPPELLREHHRVGWANVGRHDRFFRLGR
ncbi:hypothetical protein ES5_06472 [Dietzia cinnamea P4]|nr:hypothetical protein ES5_06472 [Dietzia cinnamea P4]